MSMTNTQQHRGNGADEARTMVHVKLTQQFHVRSDEAANALGAINFAAITDYSGKTLDRVAREVAETLGYEAFEQDSPERTRRYLRELRARLLKERECEGSTRKLDERLSRRAGP